MGLSLFSFIALAGLVSQVARSDDIQCIPIPGTAGGLAVIAEDNEIAGAAVLGLVNNVLQETGATQTYSFELCTSSFVLQSPSDSAGITYSYGHITVQGDSTTCLSSVPNQTTPQNINGSPCDTTDDENQVNQFWRLVNDTTSSAGVYLEFAGKLVSESDNSYYLNQVDNGVVTVNWGNASVVPPSYYLYFYGPNIS